MVGAAARGQAARAGPPDVSAVLRRGRLGPLAGPDHRPAAAAGADPGRAAGGPGPRAGPPGPGRRHPRGAVGPVRRGARAGRRAAGPRARGPLGAWARFCLREASWLIEPVARGQETRADRSAAIIAGGGAAASALVKVAVVQPLFREVLEHYDPNHPEYPNLYAFFRAFWYRLPAEIHSAMRLQRPDRRPRHPRPGPPPPARPPRPAPVATPTPPAQRRRPSRHHLPRRPRDLRADAPQPALRPARRRAHRLPPRATARSSAPCPKARTSRLDFAAAPAFFEVAVEEREHLGLGAFQLGASPAVLGPDQELDPAGHARGGHGLGELGGLGGRDERVLGALERQHRRVVLG